MLNGAAALPLAVTKRSTLETPSVMLNKHLLTRNTVSTIRNTLYDFTIKKAVYGMLARSGNPSCNLTRQRFQVQTLVYLKCVCVKRSHLRLCALQQNVNQAEGYDKVV